MGNSNDEGFTSSVIVKRTYVGLLVFIFAVSHCCVCLAQPPPAAKVTDSLRLVQIIFRHGDRTPINSYPTDPYKNESYWPDGFGQLTITGKLQEYNLGVYLRNWYSGFLTGDPLEVSVRSSGMNRCLESAACNLASLYIPQGRWVWKNDLKWQPIPIQTVPPDSDGMLNPSSTCPNADKERLKIVNSPEGQQFLDEHRTMLNYVSKHCECNLPDWRQANWLYDTLKIEKASGLPLPNWTESIWNELGYVANQSFYWDFKSKELQRLRAGLVIQELSKNMQAKVEGHLNPKQRLFMFSTHDTLLSVLMMGWGVFNRMPPPYSSAIMVELHETEPDAFAVRILYKNGTDVDPHVLVLPKCQEFCPLGHYLHHVRDLVPEDWKAECGLEKTAPALSSQAQTAIISMGCVLLLLLVGSLAMAWCLCRKPDDSIFYQLVPTN